MPRSNRGFTMIELIVVMIIMGVMATLAITRNPDRIALHEKGFRDQLVSMLRHARKLAISQQRDVCVVLTSSVASGVYANGAGCNAAAPIADPGSADPFVLTAPSGVVIAGPTSVRFDRRGRPVPNVNVVINVGSQTFTISHETGTAF
jgi:MSHA pilin protein MshC